MEKYSGENSLSIITPKNGEVNLGFFKSRLKKGNSYQVSIMAKADYFIYIFHLQLSIFIIKLNFKQGGKFKLIEYFIQNLY